MVNISFKNAEVYNIFLLVLEARKTTMTPVAADLILVKLYKATKDRYTKTNMKNELIAIGIIKKGKK